ncbi:hypothetical protein [Nonomuraea basaltis]|uniref:hypothetical protein n=1 Tax=Nonomuraea basaltis TaxID=2495887 RepID=UPI00110C6B72|nr:hypothetical protein [Nonomuraea basaltis]TMR94787.1 hypothetical protein EJK15_32260 [Nonomuraea basaltis]
MAGVLAVPIMAVVALDWAFMTLSMFLINCGGWEWHYGWTLWRLLILLGYTAAIVLMTTAIRARHGAR